MVFYGGSKFAGQVMGTGRGGKGLTQANLEDPPSRARYILPLDRGNTRTIDRTGGTYLHTTRTNPAKMKKAPEFLSGISFPASEVTKDEKTSTVYDLTPQVIKNLEKLQLEYLIAIAGKE